MRTIMFLTGTALVCLTVSAPAQTYPPNYANPSTLVDSWYRTYLGRGTEADPISRSWVDQLRQGFPPETVQAGILSSDEYYFRNGGTMQGFIQGLFRDTVGRAPSPSEMDFWLRRGYLEDRKDIAYEVLTQNPGSGVIAAPAPVAPRYPDRDWQWRRDRDWSREWGRHDYDYRRPYYPYRR